MHLSSSCPDIVIYPSDTKEDSSRPYLLVGLLALVAVNEVARGGVSDVVAASTHFGTARTETNGVGDFEICGNFNRCAVSLRRVMTFGAASSVM